MDLTKKITRAAAAFCACLCVVSPAGAISQKEFMDICLKGDALKVASALKDEGVSASKADARGMTPLMMAAQAVGNAADPNKIRLLTAAGANANAANKDRVRVLMLAALHSTNPDVITALVRAGADTEERSAKGFTALALAAAFNPNPGIADALVDLGAEVNATENTGSTPFLLAVRNGNSFEVLKALIEDGANPRTPNSAKKTPLSFLETSKKYTPEQVAYLKDAISRKSGPKPMSAERFAKLCSRAAEPRVRAYLAARTDPNAPFEGMTPLMYAARDNAHAGVVATLMKWGAKEDARDDSGRTALIHAAQSGANPRALTELLTLGARADIRDVEGKTALDYAKANPAYSDDSLLLLESILKSVAEAEERGIQIEAERRGGPDAPAGGAQATSLYKKLAEDGDEILRLTASVSELQKKLTQSENALKDALSRVDGDRTRAEQLQSLVSELNETVSSLKAEQSRETAAYRDNVERLTSLWKSEMQKNLSLVEKTALGEQNMKKQIDELTVRLQSAEKAALDLTRQKEDAEKRHLREKEEAESEYRAETARLNEAHRGELDELAARLRAAEDREKTARQYQSFAVAQHNREIIDLKSEQARAIQDTTLRYDRQIADLTERHEQDLEDARALAEKRTAEALKASAEQLNKAHGDELLNEKSRHALELVNTRKQLEDDFEKKLADFAAHKDEEFRAATAAHESETVELKKQFAQSLDALRGTLQSERDANTKLASELNELRAQFQAQTADLTERLKTLEADAQAELRQKLSEQESALKTAFEVEKARMETQHRQELLDTASKLETQHSGEINKLKDDHLLQMNDAVSQIRQTLDETREQARIDVENARAAADRQDAARRENDANVSLEGVRQGRREERQLLEAAYAQSLRQAEIRYEKLLKENQLKQKIEHDAAVEVLNTKHRHELEEASARAQAAQRDALAALKAEDERKSAEELSARERQWAAREEELLRRHASEIDRIRAAQAKSGDEMSAALKDEYERRTQALLARQEERHAAETRRLEAIHGNALRALEERYGVRTAVPQNTVRD